MAVFMFFKPLWNFANRINSGIQYMVVFCISHWFSIDSTFYILHSKRNHSFCIGFIYLYGWQYSNSIFQFQTQMINSDKIVEIIQKRSELFCKLAFNQISTRFSSPNNKNKTKQFDRIAHYELPFDAVESPTPYTEYGRYKVHSQIKPILEGINTKTVVLLKIYRWNWFIRM